MNFQNAKRKPISLKRQYRYRKRRFSKRRIKQIGILVLVIAIVGVGLFHPSNDQTTTTSNNSNSKQEEVDTSNYPSATVVIDPGHGGYDSGTIGSDGTYEKDLTLKYGLEIGEQLKELNPNLNVLYTRDSDEVTWPENEDDDLKARVKFSEDNNAQYYLSIHFNSMEDSSAHGYFAYVRSEDEVSADIYDSIVKNIQALSWSKNNELQYVDTYPLYVVSEQKIPAMLLELGHLSNYEETLSLERKSNIKDLSHAIAKAYSDYIIKNN